MKLHVTRRVQAGWSEIQRFGVRLSETARNPVSRSATGQGEMKRTHVRPTESKSILTLAAIPPIPFQLALSVQVENRSLCPFECWVAAGARFGSATSFYSVFEVFPQSVLP